jgi:hypothetical protein
MTYTLCISKDGEIIVQLGVTADEALAVVGRAIPKTSDALETEPLVKRPGPKPDKGAKRAYKRKKVLDSEVMQEAARRHPATEQIEDMLIGGATVPEIMEKVDVSAPTVYVIKARLRREGRLVE